MGALRVAMITVLLALSVILSVTAQPFNCHAECTKYGNCNKEKGVCDCPLGRSGDHCQVDSLSACRVTADAPARCGPVGARSCQCLQQCENYMIAQLDWDWAIKDRAERLKCFHRPEQGDKQSPIIPKADEQGAKYYLGAFPGKQKEITREEALEKDGIMYLPHSDCTDHCSNFQGMCVKGKDDPRKDGDCRCHYGFAGITCSKTESTCPNECSGRGKCIDSFCHCDQGYWGIGCHRSQTFVNGSAFPHPIDFKIYIYDLPPYIANEAEYWGGWAGHDPNYIAYKKFNNKIITSSVVTENPWEANLFYLPAFTYHYSGNVLSPQRHVERVLKYVHATYPWWNRTDGRDHVIWTSGDRGSCYLAGEFSLAPIKLSHFGYFDMTNSQVPMLIPGNPLWGCFHPLKDVNTPPYDTWMVGEWVKHFHIENKQTPEEAWEKRDTLLFFSGTIVHDEENYSGGTRQAIGKYLEKWEAEGIKLHQGYFDLDPEKEVYDRPYPQAYRKAKYCLSPYGHGYGMRVLQSMAAGCIPVIIQEHVFQHYEDVLPYEEFSIRLNNGDIEHLPELLKSITEEQYMKLYEGVLKYWPAFIWDDDAGGKAFEYALLSLRRRWMNHKSLYYGRHAADKFKRRSLVESNDSDSAAIYYL